MIKKWFKSTCCLYNPHVDKVLWFISTCRNALAVFFGCLLAYILELYDRRTFALTGNLWTLIFSLIFVF